MAFAADTLDALRASEMVRSGKLLLVDVRTAAERAAFGIPQGAVWIEWRGAEGAQVFGETLAAAFPDRSAALAFICSVGHRSLQAARVAEGWGYSRVYDVSEGVNGAIMGPGWRAWGMPLEPQR